MMHDKWKSFDTLLQENSPNVEKCVITRARNAFMRRYGNYAVAPEIALAIATPGELLGIRNAGKKCQDVYANAQLAVREVFASPIKDILELKDMFYAEADKRKVYTSNIDRMILQCVEMGMRSARRFEQSASFVFAPNTMEWHGDSDIPKLVYLKLTKQYHPDVKDPQTYIVRYIGEKKNVCHTGVDEKGKDILLKFLQDNGYKTNMSGKVDGMPIHFINAEKKKEEEIVYAAV